MLARSGGDGVIQRVDDGMPGTTGSPPPATFNASAPAAPATAATNDDEGETDVEDMVDRVMRKLMRRLAIASERKGLTRWTS